MNASVTARHVQLFLAGIFILLGGWCMLLPHMVEGLVFRTGFRHLSPTSAILMGCFGAQAVLAGLVIWWAEFKPQTFLVFGLAGSLPFFAFNYYFYFVLQAFTEWMLLDFAGNLGILTCGLVGYRLKSRELQAAA